MANTDRTTAIAPTLGDLCTVRIDPHWPYVKSFYGPDTGNPIGDKLSFTFLDLEAGISEDMQPNYADTEVVGRAEQYKTFVGATNRIYQLTFKFQAQGILSSALSLAAAARALNARLGFGPFGNAAQVKQAESDRALILEREVVNPMYWMEALKHPIIGNGGLSHAPPPVLLTVGRLIPTSRCVVVSATPTWQLPFDPETLLPFAGEVAVTFAVVRRDIKRNLFLHNRAFGGGR